MPSETDALESDRIINSWRLLDFHAASKMPVVDTEVDPPQQNSRSIKRRIVSPREMTMNLFCALFSVSGAVSIETTDCFIREAKGPCFGGLVCAIGLCEYNSP